MLKEGMFRSTVIAMVPLVDPVVQDKASHVLLLLKAGTNLDVLK